MKLITVNCPACGGTLEIADGLSSGSCLHCGSKIIMDWDGQTGVAVHLELGKTFLQAGNYKEADIQFSKALERNAASGEVWFWAAITKLLQSQGAWHGIDVYFDKSNLTLNDAVEKTVFLMKNSSMHLPESILGNNYEWYAYTSRSKMLSVLLLAALCIKPEEKNRVLLNLENKAQEYEPHLNSPHTDSASKKMFMEVQEHIRGLIEQINKFVP